MPDLNKQQIKRLESLAFRFLWDNKTDKVARDHAKLAEKAGGLGALDIKSFWQSLKFSWIRRATNTSAFWPEILISEVKTIVGHEVTIPDILRFGASYLNVIGKKMTNKFWKQIFCSVELFMQGALFSYPEKIQIAPIWDNPLITRNNRAIKKSAFPTLSGKLITVSDFYRPGTGTLLAKAELERGFDIEVTEEDLIEMHFIIKQSRRNLGLKIHEIWV